MEVGYRFQLMQIKQHATPAIDMRNTCHPITTTRYATANYAYARARDATTMYDEATFPHFDYYTVRFGIMLLVLTCIDHTFNVPSLLMLALWSLPLFHVPFVVLLSQQLTLFV